MEVFRNVICKLLGLLLRSQTMKNFTGEHFNPVKLVTSTDW